MSRAGDRDAVRAGRRVTWLLRHGAIESGLAMDPAGWAAVADVRALLDLDADLLARAVAGDAKGRIEVDGERMRACQGHSPAGTPVTLEALEASWTPHTADDDLWHGTNREAWPAIRREGLHAGRRTHVHLAVAPDSKVGKRARVDVLVRISAPLVRAAGLELFRSTNGVVLVRAVPPTAIVGTGDRS